MLLFAEGESPVTWIAVAVAVVSLIGTAISGLFVLLGNRDKLAYDAKMVRLEATCDACERGHKEAQAEILLLRGEVDRLRDMLYRSEPNRPGKGE